MCANVKVYTVEKVNVTQSCNYTHPSERIVWTHTHTNDINFCLLIFRCFCQTQYQTQMEFRFNALIGVNNFLFDGAQRCCLRQCKQILYNCCYCICSTSSLFPSATMVVRCVWWLCCVVFNVDALFTFDLAKQKKNLIVIFFCQHAVFRSFFVCSFTTIRSILSSVTFIWKWKLWKWSDLSSRSDGLYCVYLYSTQFTFKHLQLPTSNFQSYNEKSFMIPFYFSIQY